MHALLNVGRDDVDKQVRLPIVVDDNEKEGREELLGFFFPDDQCPFRSGHDDGEKVLDIDTLVLLNCILCFALSYVLSIL